jgi:hypothetical protein
MACHTIVVPTGKDSVPTDSGHSIHNFAVAKSLTQSLSWAAWRSKMRAELRSPLRAHWSIYELTHPGASLEAGRRVEKHSIGKPRICWHTIFICAKPQWYGKLLKQHGFHASRIAFLLRIGTSFARRGQYYSSEGTANFASNISAVCSAPSTQPCASE